MVGVQPLRRCKAQDVGRVRQQRVQAGVQLQARPAAPPRLGVDVKVILTPRYRFGTRMEGESLMKYTGWCQNDFNVQGYPRLRESLARAPVVIVNCSDAHVGARKLRNPGSPVVPAGILRPAGSAAASRRGWLWDAAVNASKAYGEGGARERCSGLCRPMARNSR
jgi:hypothetical protein